MHKSPLSARRSLLVVALVVGGLFAASGSASAGPQGYAQVGAISTDTTDYNATGVGSYIGHYPLPQSTVDNSPVWFWVGVNLADGTFVQVGTDTVSSTCETQMEVFAATETPTGQWTIQHEACGVSVPTYAWNNIFEYQELTPGYYDWKVGGAAGLVSGFDAFAEAANTGNNFPYIVAELTQTTGTSDQLGPTGYYPALETKHGSGSYYATLSAKAYFGYTYGVCPPYKVIYLGYNHVGLGSPQSGSCVSNGSPLW